MAPRTRSVSSSPVKKSASARPSPTKQDSPRHEPLHLLVLPEGLSTEARILSLPSPRDQRKIRFLFCPWKGLYEFTRVAAPPLDYRSILFAPVEDDGPTEANEEVMQKAISRGFVQKDATLLVATHFDLMFLLLPLLPSTMRKSGKVMFQPLDDLFEAHLADDAHLRYLVQHGKSLVERVMGRFCDTIDAGDERMFRVSEDKVARIMHAKAEAMVSRGLPASMEDRFVTRALETPVLSIKREESTVTNVTQETTIAEHADIKSESFDSVSTTASSAAPSIFSDVSGASSITTSAPESLSPDITHLMRLKVACDFMFASYLPATISECLRPKMMQNNDVADFTPLLAHLKHLAVLKADALASRSVGDFSRKRGNAEDEEASEDRAEKKRKLEEEEKRKKATLSRGVKELSKVNVAGMKKMSDFFTKRPPIAKAKS